MLSRGERETIKMVSHNVRIRLPRVNLLRRSGNPGLRRSLFHTYLYEDVDKAFVKVMNDHVGDTCIFYLAPGFDNQQ